jgi:hypothetical protein
MKYLAALFVVAMACSGNGRLTATLPVPTDCDVRPSLPISIALDFEMDDYRDAYGQAMHWWNRRLGTEAFRWAREDEPPDVLVYQGSWNVIKPLQMAEAGGLCIAGHYVGTITHNRVLDETEAFYFGTHELGHIIGLAHSRDERSVMFPALRVNGLLDEEMAFPSYQIMAADVAAVRVLYGL